MSPGGTGEGQRLRGVTKLAGCLAGFIRTPPPKSARASAIGTLMTCAKRRHSAG